MQYVPSVPKLRCPLFGRCGGCQWMDLSYSKQLEMKRQKVVDALQTEEVEPCLPSPKEFGYRNKIQLPVKNRGQRLILGLYERGSNELVEVKQCAVHTPIGEGVYQAILPILNQSAIRAYDSDRGTGELRHLLIRSTSNEVLVTLVTAASPTPLLKRIAEEIMETSSSVKGVIHNQQTAKDNVILGDHYQLLAGSASITETLLGLTFHISSASFFQVNPLQAEKLYQKVIEFAALSGEETVLDAYCGVGTLALLFAKRTKEVIGIECVSEAVEDAKRNAKENGILNALFIHSTVEAAIDTLPKIDLILLNPPRKGCLPSVLEAVGRLAPKKLIYISCNPVSLARDLLFLKKFGYTLEIAQPFDMFPQTDHVECVVKLSC